MQAKKQPDLQDYYDMFVERAALSEYDGRLSRDKAEKIALAEVLREFWRHKRAAHGETEGY